MTKWNEVIDLVHSTWRDIGNQALKSLPFSRLHTAVCDK